MKRTAEQRNPPALVPSAPAAQRPSKIYVFRQIRKVVGRAKTQPPGRYLQYLFATPFLDEYEDDFLNTIYILERSHTNGENEVHIGKILSWLVFC